MGTMFEDFGKYLFVVISTILMWELLRYNVAFAVVALAPVGMATLVTLAINAVRKYAYEKKWNDE